MVHLWQAEWLKVRKRPANRGLFITVLVIVGIAIFSMVVVGLIEEQGSTEWQNARQSLAYPQSLNTPTVITSTIMVLLAIIFTANSVGSEYSRDTWKMILTRHPKRHSFLVIKLLSTFAFMFIVVGASILIGVSLSFIGALIIGGETVQTTDLQALTPYVKSFASIFIDIGFYSSITLIGTILTRSTIGGIVVGFISSALFTMMGAFSPLLARISPLIHINNIQANWIFNEPNMVTEVLGLTNDLSPWVSLMVVGSYTTLFLGIGFYMFRKRDIAGS